MKSTGINLAALGLLAKGKKGKKKATVPEKEIQRACLEFLHAVGIWCVRVNSGAIKLEKRFIRLGTPGTPDILACADGRFLGIEVKAETGKLRPAQVAALDAIRAAGGLGFVVRSVDDLEQALRLEGLLSNGRATHEK